MIITTNTIHYPSNIKCKCGRTVKANMDTIDSSTWDLICECGEIAYLHPNRDERKNQIDNLLNW